ncbi:hypothetical protein P8452_13768 [Trifolium repens]|nr:hypothetical protein P8452_13768 [Trifolium repens]
MALTCSRVKMIIPTLGSEFTRWEKNSHASQKHKTHLETQNVTLSSLFVHFRPPPFAFVRICTPPSTSVRLCLPQYDSVFLVRTSQLCASCNMEIINNSPETSDYEEEDNVSQAMDREVPLQNAELSEEVASKAKKKTKRKAKGANQDEKPRKLVIWVSRT